VVYRLFREFSRKLLGEIANGATPLSVQPTFHLRNSGHVVDTANGLKTVVNFNLPHFTYVIVVIIIVFVY